MPFNSGLPQLQAILSPYVWILIVIAAVIGTIAVILFFLTAVLQILQRLLLGFRDLTRTSKPSVMSIDISDSTQSKDHEELEQSNEHQEPKGEDEPVSPSRRKFLSALGIALASIGAVIVGIPALGVLFSPVLRRPPETWRAVGRVDDFPVGDTVKVTFLDPTLLPWAGFAAEDAAWLRRRSEEEFVVFSVYCTHTGCPVAWFTDAELFMCPCHGGVFDRDGKVVSGPPQRPLSLHPVRVRNGQVEIRTLREPLPVWEWGRVSRCADETERTASVGKDCSEQLTRSDGSSEVES